MMKKRKNKKILHKIIVASLLLIVSFHLTGCNKKQESVSENSKQTIVIGIDQFEPYSYLDFNGNYVGIDVELAKIAFNRIGYEPEFKFISWEDKNEYLTDGSIDCIWSCFSMTDREDKYTWAGPYMYSSQVIAVKKSSSIYTLADLKDKRVGVQATTKAENLFLHVIDSDLPEVKYVNSFSSTEELFAVLRKGYVDAIAGHEAFISKVVNDNDDAYRILEESPYISKIGVAFLKDTHVELAEELTEIIEELKEDGTIAEIAQKYGLDAQKVVLGGEE